MKIKHNNIAPIPYDLDEFRRRLIEKLGTDLNVDSMIELQHKYYVAIGTVDNNDYFFSTDAELTSFRKKYNIIAEDPPFYHPDEFENILAEELGISHEVATIFHHCDFEYSESIGLL